MFSVFKSGRKPETETKKRVLECVELPAHANVIETASFKEPTEVEKFHNMLDFAKQILNATPKTSINGSTHPLIDVVRLLGRSIQAHYLTLPLYYTEEDLPSKQDACTANLMFPIDLNISSKVDVVAFYDAKVAVKNYRKKVCLEKDVVLPSPWKKSRYISAITDIGAGRLYGNWRQDYHNHSLELWLPMGISWVGGGNHSIASGIIQGVGKIKPDITYDISKLYDYIECDGKHYLRKQDKSILAPVRNVEFAAIFEIGRMMRENRISY